MSNLTPRLALLVAMATIVILADPLAAAPRQFLQSRHYRIYSDLDPELTADLARRMDAMYEEYARRMVDFTTPGVQPTLEVHLFRHRVDYQRFINDEIANTAGIFIARRNCLAAVLENVSRDELRRTLQHEAFHQFAYNHIAATLPAWLSEGLAELFEDGIWTGNRFRIGQVPVWRLDKLRRDIDHNRLIPFQQIMHWDHEQWNARMASPADAAIQYNQAWAMVHYLVFATDRDDRFLHRQRLIRMLFHLRDGSDGWTAFRAAFSDNIPGFQARFLEYARRLQPTPEAIAIDRHQVLSGLLRLLREEGREYASATDFRNDVVRARMRLFREEDGQRVITAEDPSVYFLRFDGRPLRPHQLFFQPRPGAPYADLVTVPAPDLQLRTRFHRSPDGRIETELLIEHPATFANTAD